MKQEITGIVISEVSYSETSKIINVLTENGIYGIMAKGAKRLNSPLKVGTSKLNLSKFNINYKNDGLSLLTSVDVINDFRNIIKDINKVSYAIYLVELATQVMKHNKDKDIYNILIDSLTKINEGYDYKIISNILETKYLQFLGVMPVIDCCAICGSKNNIVTLSSSRGGYICKNCLKNDVIVSEKTIKLIRMFYYLDIAKITKLEVSNQTKIEISDFLDDYYDRYTGLYLKSKILLKNLNKVD